MRAAEATRISESGGPRFALWWGAYLRVHPDLDTEWKRQVHALQDSSFDRAIAAFTGSAAPPPPGVTRGGVTLGRRSS